MKFNHLNVPSHWQNYWTRFPEGHTILEALIQWVSQVDDMVDNQNTLNANVEQFRNEMDEFIGRFDERLQTEVTQTLKDWQNTGFLNVLINGALQWQLDGYITTNEQDKLLLTTQLRQTEQEANRKRTLEDLDAEVISAIAGGEGTSFDLLSIPQPKSVRPSKIDKNYQANLFNPETITDGYIAAPGGTLTKIEGYYVSDYIEIPKDGEYRFSSNRPSTHFVRYDEEKNPITWVAGSASDDLNTPVTHTITATKYIRVNANHSLVPPDKYVVAEAEEFDSADGKINWLKITNENLASDFKFPVNQTETGRFNGLNVLVTGDSITEKNIRATKNWHDYLNDKLHFGNVINDGKSGTGLVKPFEARPGLLDRIASWQTDLDLILIMGAMNDGTSGEFGDSVEGLPVGAFTDTPGKTSVYAAMHKLMQDLIVKYPNTPIGFISSTPRSQVGARGKCWGIDGWFEEYNKAYKEVCAHYSIPFLDLYHQSGLRPWNATNNMTYFSNPENASGDGIHPNELGQELMAHKIYEFVKQFM